MKYIAISAFGCTLVAAAAYVTPHLIQARQVKNIIANNDRIAETLGTSTSGQEEGPTPPGLFGSYL